MEDILRQAQNCEFLPARESSAQSIKQKLHKGCYVFIQYEEQLAIVDQLF